MNLKLILPSYYIYIFSDQKRKGLENILQNGTLRIPIFCVCCDKYFFCLYLE